MSEISTLSSDQTNLPFADEEESHPIISSSSIEEINDKKDRDVVNENDNHYEMSIATKDEVAI